MLEIVSVIIPNYNHGCYLAEAVKSVLAQTYDDIKIIIIDNFSTDNSKDIAQKIIEINTDKKIKFLQLNNKGIIAASRNYGVNNSEGEYLAFLDSDDVWHPNKLEMQVPALQRLDLGAVASRFRPIGEVECCYDHLAHMDNEGDMVVSYLDILMSNPIVTSSVLIKREHFYEIGGFNESSELCFIEDWELWLRLANQFGNFMILNKKLLDYRVYYVKGRDLTDDYARRCMLVLEKQYELGLVSVQLYKRSRSSAYINYAGKCLQANKKYKRIPLVKSFFSTKKTRDKFRCLVFILLSFVPKSCVKLIRNNYYRIKVG